jgi:hypothetical protein
MRHGDGSAARALTITWSSHAGGGTVTIKCAACDRAAAASLDAAHLEDSLVWYACASAARKHLAAMGCPHAREARDA